MEVLVLDFLDFFKHEASAAGIP